MWKAKHEENYLVRIEFRTWDDNEMGTIGATSGKAVETSKTSNSKTTFMEDAT